MNEKYLDLLHCPEDSSDLNHKNIKCIDGEIVSAELICKTCNKKYKINNGIPNFSSNQSYVRNFGFEWERHSRTQLDNELKYNEDVFFTVTGLKKSEINGKLFLDAGCGVGRFSKFIQKYGGKVIGVDLSSAVVQANNNLGNFPHCNFLQSNINNLPFKPYTFDYIFSIGVLHHTPDPKLSFMSLVPYLKKGGSISICVYSKGALLYEWSKRFRKYTVKMKSKNLYFLCKVACRFLYPIYKLPLLKLLIYYFPIDMNPNYRWRLLGTFDAYSPRYASTHTWAEVYNWFKEAGLVKISLKDTDSISIGGFQKK